METLVENHAYIPNYRSGGLVIGYVRVSTEGQRENTSITEQARLISEHCEVQRLNLIAIYFDVESAASVTKREGFSQALEMIFSNRADGLVVHSLDRFSRAVGDAEQLRRKFDLLGKQLVSVSELMNFSTSSGKLFFQLKTVFSEAERELIGERTRRGKAAKKARGGWSGHAVPYGFRVESAELVRDEAEQRVIRFILRLSKLKKNNGRTVSCYWIADILNRKGIPTKSQSKTIRKRKKITSGKWSNVVVWHILKRTREVDGKSCTELQYNAVGRAPYGWQYVNRQPVPVQQEQLVIAEMRAMKSQGMPLQSIADALNLRGIPSRLTKWGSGQVEAIVSCRRLIDRLPDLYHGEEQHLVAR